MNPTEPTRMSEGDHLNRCTIETHQDALIEFAEESAQSIAESYHTQFGHALHTSTLEELTTAIWEGLLSDSQ